MVGYVFQYVGCLLDEPADAVGYVSCTTGGDSDFEKNRAGTDALRLLRVLGKIKHLIQPALQIAAFRFIIT